jgi:hypothetical protein
MNSLFSYDDLGVLTQSLGYAPDERELADMLKAARVRAARMAPTNVCTIPSDSDAARLLMAEHRAATFRTQKSPHRLR